MENLSSTLLRVEWTHLALPKYILFLMNNQHLTLSLLNMKIMFSTKRHNLNLWGTVHCKGLWDAPQYHLWYLPFLHKTCTHTRKIHSTYNAGVCKRKCMILNTMWIQAEMSTKRVNLWSPARWSLRLLCNTFRTTTCSFCINLTRANFLLVKINVIHSIGPMQLDIPMLFDWRTVEVSLKKE